MSRTWKKNSDENRKSDFSKMRQRKNAGRYAIAAGASQKPKKPRARAVGLSWEDEKQMDVDFGYDGW